MIHTNKMWLYEIYTRHLVQVASNFWMSVRQSPRIHYHWFYTFRWLSFEETLSKHPLCRYWILRNVAEELIKFTIWYSPMQKTSCLCLVRKCRRLSLTFNWRLFISLLQILVQCQWHISWRNNPQYGGQESQAVQSSLTNCRCHSYSNDISL